MRTTLNLDDNALREALEASPGKTRTDVINSALREYVQRQRIAEIREFRGQFQWDGNLDLLRKREPGA